MKVNWRVDVWGGEPSIADIVDVDTGRSVAQTVSTEVARFIVAMCASSESMNEDDLKFLKECESVGNEASPEPWTIDRSGSFSAIFANVLQRHAGEDSFVKRQISSWGGIKSENDLRFTIVARSAMPLLCTMVREQDKRARHAEQERNVFGTRIAELGAEIAVIRSKCKP